MTEQIDADQPPAARWPAGPTGWSTADDFEPVTEPPPELADGEALMRTIYLGMDATVRTWLNRGEGYLPAVEIGEVVRCSGIGRVVATRCAAYEVGDVAYGAARVAGLRRHPRRHVHHQDGRRRPTCAR